MLDTLLETHSRYAPPPEKEEQKQVSFSQSTSKISALQHPIKWLVYDRFSRDNWFGSAISLVLMRSNYVLLKGALQRKIDGKIQPDPTRVISFAILALEKIWSFSSGRGGMVPEGRTMLERMKNALKSANQSSAQFELLINLPVRFLQIYGNFDNGLKAYGYQPSFAKNGKSVGFNKVEGHEPAEKIRLWMGGFQIIWQIVALRGFFKSPKETKSLAQEEKKPSSSPVIFSRSQSISLKGHEGEKKSFMGIVQALWNHDRELVMGAFLSTVITAMSGMEGFLKTDRSPKEARSILQGTALNALTSLSYQYYQFSRIIKDNYMQDNGKIDKQPFAERLRVEAAGEGKHVMSVGAR